MYVKVDLRRLPALFRLPVALQFGFTIDCTGTHK